VNQTPGTRPEDTVWEEWLTAWETYLSAVQALTDSPDAPSPHVPTVPQPPGAPPAHLRTRLLRAQALAEDTTSAVRRKLASRGRSKAFTTPATAPTPGTGTLL
jgi:hypothetical protein